jgi:hypothetical protein
MGLKMAKDLSDKVTVKILLCSNPAAAHNFFLHLKRGNERDPPSLRKRGRQSKGITPLTPRNNSPVSKGNSSSII